MDTAKTEYRAKTFKILQELESTYYSIEEKNSLREFVMTYSRKDFNKIKFDWNQESGSEFDDLNYEFRERVAIYYILNCKNNDNVLLCKDVFLEETKCAKKSWGANEYIFFLGEKLLNGSRGKYIYEFLEGALASFDTYGCCLSIRLNKDLVDELEESIDELLLATEGDNKAEKLLTDGREYIKNFLT